MAARRVLMLRQLGGTVAGAAIALGVLGGAPPARAVGLGSAAVDGTPPVITPSISGTLGANGWHVSNVTVAWNVSDPESGITQTTGCDTRTFTTDTTGVGVMCSATNGVGLTGSYTATVKIDKTLPSTNAALDRAPDFNGWYTRPITARFTGSDATSGVASCSSPIAYGGPDTGSGQLTGTCQDRAGNQSSGTVALKYDATAPSVSANPDRPPNANGWYNRAVTFTFSGSDATSGIQDCAPGTTYSGPDNVSASVSGSCRDAAGNPASRVASFRYDATNPSVSELVPLRGPDSNGWYTFPVSFSFSGSDATSGIESCEAPTYGGPDSGAASATGTCRDRAGNTAPRTFALKYDATAPTLTKAVPARPPDRYGWYSSPVAFSFTGADAGSGIASCTTVTYGGPSSERASVTGTCSDNAGHASAPLAFTFRYSRPLLTPASGQNVRLPVTLDWVNVEGARFYNVQVWKGREKILSAWPSASQYRFKRSWRFAGERHSLERGVRYRWYVWPRIGRRYGRLLGGGVFDVVRGAAT